VSRSSSAVVIFASPNTLDHSAKSRLVVTITLVCSYSVQLGQQMEQQRSAGLAEGQVAQLVEDDQIQLSAPMQN
jgi:Rod binding domain-containing protein